MLRVSLNWSEWDRETWSFPGGWQVLQRHKRVTFQLGQRLHKEDLGLGKFYNSITSGGNSVAVLWLGFHASTGGDMGSIPSRESKIMYAADVVYINK